MNPTLYQFLITLHSIGRWIMLVLLLVTIFKSLTAGEKPFTSFEKKAGLWLMITTDIMLLVGIILWLGGNWGLQQIQTTGMSAVMENDVSRFFVAEHTTAMVVAVILIHIGKAQSKKNISNRFKHQRTFWFYLIALLVILISIPWPFRETGMGRGWI
jgi:uncharacterized membrane protein